jgi:hypothetical protein
VRPIGIQIRSSTWRNNGTGVDEWGALPASSSMQLRRYDDDRASVEVHFRVKTAASSHVGVANGSTQDTITAGQDPVDVRVEVSMEPVPAVLQVTLDAPNTAGISDPRPDVRGELFDVQVLDTELARQIAQGELSLR